MNKRFKVAPLKGIQVKGVGVGERTPNLLMGEHVGEYVRGDIMDANAVIQAFDELKGNVDGAHDTLEELVDEIHTNATVINGAINYTHKVKSESEARDEEEKNARVAKDNELDAKIDKEIQDRTAADTAEAEARVAADNATNTKLDKEISDRTDDIAKEKAERIAADEAEKTARENADEDEKLARSIAFADEAKARKEADDAINNKIKVIDGDSNTEGSFRKAIADVVGAAPEAYDTLKEIADKLKENDDLHDVIQSAIAEKASNTALNNEVEARTNADTALEGKIEEAKTTIEGVITNEANTRKEADIALQEKITAEETRATDREDDLEGLINTERNRATAVETSIADVLNTETTARTNADTALESKINDLKYIPFDSKTGNEYSMAVNSSMSFYYSSGSDAQGAVQITSSYIRAAFGEDYSNYSGSELAFYTGSDFLHATRYTRDGIFKTDGKSTEAFSTNGGVIDTTTFALKTELPDLTNYATKDELPTVPTKVSELENDANYLTELPGREYPIDALAPFTVTTIEEAQTAINALVNRIQELESALNELGLLTQQNPA